MRNVRIRIEKILLQHPNITAADGPGLGHMVAQQLRQMIRAGDLLPQQSVESASVRVPVSTGARTPITATAAGIARGIYQAISTRK